MTEAPDKEDLKRNPPELSGYALFCSIIHSD